MKKAEYHNAGYYVITGEKEYWCPTMRGAFETQNMFGGEVLTAEGRNRRKMLKSKTNKEVKDLITMHLTALVEEAVDYFGASRDGIDNAIEKLYRAMMKIMFEMDKSNKIEPGNHSAMNLSDASILIDEGISILKRVK